MPSVAKATANAIAFGEEKIERRGPKQNLIENEAAAATPAIIFLLLVCNKSVKTKKKMFFLFFFKIHSNDDFCFLKTNKGKQNNEKKNLKIKLKTNTERIYFLLLYYRVQTREH